MLRGWSASESTSSVHLSGQLKPALVRRFGARIEIDMEVV